MKNWEPFVFSPVKKRYNFVVPGNYSCKRNKKIITENWAPDTCLLQQIMQIYMYIYLPALAMLSHPGP